MLARTTDTAPLYLLVTLPLLIAAILLAGGCSTEVCDERYEIAEEECGQQVDPDIRAEQQAEACIGERMEKAECAIDNVEAYCAYLDGDRGTTNAYRQCFVDIEEKYAEEE